MVLKIACVAFLASIFLGLPLCGQRDASEAKSWLAWNSSHREAYVGAYIQGYYRGYAGGCHEGLKNSPPPVQPGVENFHINKCLDRKLDFTRGISLAKDITTFYERYPGNRNLYVAEILDEIGKGRSIAEIHENPPFRPMEH